MNEPTSRDFYATQRGGGLLSEAFSQRLGSRLAVLAHRRGLSPSQVSLANLLVGLITSVAVALLAGPVADGRVLPWPAGAIALAGWNLAYALDCADGQLARVTGQTSPAGARLDILCDVAVQISVVTAIVVTAQAQAAWIPAWLPPVFAGTWLVNLITSILATSSASASLIMSTSTVVRILKLIRDYAAIVMFCGVVMAFAPALTPWIMVVFMISNGGFLVLSLAQAFRTGLARDAMV
jgi:phosphatidylglycerophosphate synthase